MLTAPKLDPRGTSREIHESVTRVLASELSVYEVDAALLASLAPTHVITQVHCEVCAVSLRDVRAATADWPGTTAAVAAPEVVALGASTLVGVLADFLRVGASLGATDRAEALVARTRERMEAVAALAATAPRRPRVAAIEWLDPLMAAGNWIPEMIEMAGGENLFGERGAHSPWLDPKALVAANPEVLVVFPCGFPLARGLAEVSLLSKIPGLDQTAAARSGAIFVADGHHLFNRPGPRLAESLETLAEILHPNLFDFGRQEFWSRVSL